MRCLLVAVVVAATASAAHADRAQDIVDDPIVLVPGEWRARLTMEVNLGRPAGSEAVTVGEPLSLAPEFGYGLTDRLTLALISGRRPLGLIEAGGGACVGGCERLADAGVEATYLARGGPLAVAPRARVLMRDFDPAKPAATVGALARWHRGRFAITSDPYLRLGLANRDRGNRAALVVPIWLAVQPTCRWLVALHTGYDADLAVAGDGWHGPLGLIVATRPTPRLEIGLEVGFRSLLGPQNQIRERAALLTVGYRSAL